MKLWATVVQDPHGSDRKQVMVQSALYHVAYFLTAIASDDTLFSDPFKGRETLHIYIYIYTYHHIISPSETTESPRNYWIVFSHCTATARCLGVGAVRRDKRRHWVNWWPNARRCTPEQRPMLDINPACCSRCYSFGVVPSFTELKTGILQ